MKVLIDLTGKAFGRLTVLHRAEASLSGHTRWHCFCACGKALDVLAQSLREGRSQSCGCDKVRLSNTKPRQAKHGQSKSAEYYIWSTMKRRCMSPDHESYPDYGGRGVTIDPKWLADFRVFLKDVGPRPTSAHSLDRYPNNDGNYEPGNVRWATPAEQQNNKRNTFMVPMPDGARSLQDVARTSGVNANALRARIKRGAKPEQAIQELKNRSNA